MNPQVVNLKITFRKEAAQTDSCPSYCKVYVGTVHGAENHTSA